VGSAACRVGLLVVIGSAVAGCSAFSSSHVGSNAAHRPLERETRHWITVHQGQIRTFPRGATALPLTIACPKRPGQTIGSGLTQVIRTPLRRGKTTLFGDAIAGPTIKIAVSSSGVTRVSCTR